jgi:hypothetical protein
VSTDNSYLVVEGTISDGDITAIRLSKTVKVSTETKVTPLDNATVFVEEEAGAQFQLTYNPNTRKFDSGSALNLNKTKKYRLRITVDGKEYASDYVPVKVNPAIDNIEFNAKPDKLEISIDTHDPANNTRYYRWDYDETWRFHASFQSDFIVNPITKQINYRSAADQSYYCFANDTSSTILIGSTAKLTQDVVAQALITTIPFDAEKLELRYSILVRQYAITKEEYQFWENIKKNTEQLGSIFDSQPSQLVGNIHCITAPKEPVIGYISATNVQQKRIFISNSQLPQDWYPKKPYACSIDSALFFNPKTMANEVQNYIINSDAVPLQTITMGNIVLGYTYSSIECSDCRIRGKVEQPPFWIP